MTRFNILILEDAFNLSAQWISALEALGHKCVSFIWVKSIGDGKLTGCNRDQVRHTVNLADFDLALVDGFLGLDGIMGWNCIPHLKGASVPCVTTSSFGNIGGDALEIEKGDVLANLEKILSCARVSSRAA